MRGPSLLPYAWWSQLTAAGPRAPVRTQDSFGGDAMGVNRQIYKEHQHESDQGRVRESRSWATRRELWYDYAKPR
jgi:hypothetical protein